jgi:hypothetical protein
MLRGRLLDTILALDLTLKVTADTGNAEKKLRDVEDGLHGIERAASRTAEPLADVAKRLGGISPHTHSVAASVQKLGASSQATVGHLGGLTTAWKNLVGAFLASNVIERMVTGLVAFGSEAIANASAIVDLSSKTGLSTRTIQEFGYVARQTGASMEAFTTAAFQLGVHLAGGSRSVVSGIKELGLSYDALRAMSPDQQFKEIARALHDMVDPQERNRIAVELFGRSAKDILPAIAEGYDSIASHAIVASDKQVRAIDRLADRWDAFVAKQQAKGLTFLGSWAGQMEDMEQRTGVPGILGAPGALLRTLLYGEPGDGEPLVPPGAPLAFRAPNPLEPPMTVEEAMRRTERMNRKRPAAPYVIPTAGGPVVVNGIPMGAFGLPTQMNDYSGMNPSLSYNLLEGVPGAFGASDPRKWTAAPDWRNMRPAGGYANESWGGQNNPFRRNNLGFSDDDADSKMGKTMNAVAGAYDVYQGAQFVWQSTAGGSTASRAGHGAMAGMKAGAMFGPYGAAIGAGVGALVGLAKGIAAGSQKHQDMIAANKQIGGLQSDVLSQFGSKENIKALGGGELLAAWDSKNVAGLKVFSAELDAFKAKANTASNDMIRNALVAGTAIPASMRPVLESLIKQGQLTQENANLLMGLPEKGVPAFAQVAEAAALLGVDLDAIGNKVKNIKLNEQAEAVALAFETLRDAGADMGAVFEQSAPKVQKMLDDALKAGLSLPESIKPWLEKMVDAGLLVDDTGEKLTDLSRFTFTETLEASVDRLITKLDELIGTLTLGVGGAIDGLDGRSATVHVKRVYDDGVPEGPDDHVPGATAGGKVLVFGKPLAAVRKGTRLAA